MNVHFVPGSARGGNHMADQATILGSTHAAFWETLAPYTSSNLFASRPWLEMVAAAYGFSVSASVLQRDGTLLGALVFAHIHDAREERLISFPFSDYCDPLAGETDWHDLIAPLICHHAPIYLRCLRNTTLAVDPRFEIPGRVAWHGADLTLPEDVLWSRIAGKARTHIRKAINHGLIVREGRSLEDLRTFFGMHCHVRKAKYRLLPQPFAFFEQLHAVFSTDDRLTVLLAEDDGVAVAGAVYIAWGDTLYYKFSAAIDRTWSPSDLLIWDGMRLARRRGLARFDFGASDLDQPGLLSFKRKFASEEREIVRYRWLPPNYDAAPRRRADALLSTVTGLLTDAQVPDTLTRKAGEELYGLFC